MPLTYEEAYDLTSADLNDDQRKSAALALQAGSAANDIYWSHADTITQLQARAAGHGAPPAPDPAERPGGEAAEDRSAVADADATAIEEANPTAENARLRALLADHGISPDETGA